MKEKRTNGGSLWVSVIEIERDKREFVLCCVVCMCVVQIETGLKMDAGQSQIWVYQNKLFDF